MPQSADQIMAELESFYAPQKQIVQQQVAQIPQYYQAQEQGLGVAKDNAFRDITNAASAKGMVYSGMPIAEQSRYTGERYLPALAGLKRQQGQETTGLQSTLADIASRQAQQAYGIREQQVNREQQARQADLNRQQQERQFAIEQAAKRSSGGGGRSGGGSGGGGATNRDIYNSALAQLQDRLKSGQAPSYEQAVSQLTKDFANKGISRQETGDYLHQLYGRYFNTSQTKKYYG